MMIMTTQQGLEQATDEQRIRLIEEQVESTVDCICDHYKKDYGVGNRSDLFEALLNREKNTLLQQKFLKQQPEKFVEQNLVWPLLSILGYEFKIEARLGTGGTVPPDFAITNLSSQVIGEVKTLGFHNEAESQIIEYLAMTECSYGIITDGLYWEFVELSTDGNDEKLNEINKDDLRGIVAEHLSDNDYVGESIVGNISNISTTTATDFYRRFNRESVAEI